LFARKIKNEVCDVLDSCKELWKKKNQ
jgi:hypothetical protein